MRQWGLPPPFTTPDTAGPRGRPPARARGGGTRGAGTRGDGEDAWEDPDYDAAFPQDHVPRLDITITPGNWEAMLDDMTELVVAFGEGGPFGSGGVDLT